MFEKSKYFNVERRAIKILLCYITDFLLFKSEERKKEILQNITIVSS